MENADIYKAPDSEVTPTGKYQFFGGWLRFYQVINVISLVIFALVLGAMGWFYLTEPFAIGTSLDVGVAVLEMIPGILVSGLSIKYLAVKDERTSQKLADTLRYYPIASIAIYALVFGLYEMEKVIEKPISFWGSAIYYLIWSSYFRKSVRVKEYYGDNAY